MGKEKDNHNDGESSGKSAFASPVHAVMQGVIKIPVTYKSRKKVTSPLSFAASSTYDHNTQVIFLCITLRSSKLQIEEELN